MPVTRRRLDADGMGAALGAALTARVDSTAERSRTFCLFSKHLPELEWGALARAAGMPGSAAST